jgi:hypothetical protein
MAQVVSITSEALQATIRNLLPSQQGFGEDLQASNVITPIIDLTPTAEGSILREDLQTAFGFGLTHTQTSNGTATLASTPGFYRVFGNLHYRGSATNEEGSIQINDGASDKVVFEVNALGSGGADIASRIVPYDFNCFLRAGDSLTQTSSAAVVVMNSTTQQIATVTGELVVPLGYVSE